MRAARQRKAVVETVNRIVLTRGAAEELGRIVAGSNKPLALLADLEQALIALAAGPSRAAIMLGSARRQRAGLRIQAWLGERPAGADAHQFDSVNDAVSFVRRQCGLPQ